jgi:hypothetical protein
MESSLYGYTQSEALGGSDGGISLGTICIAMLPRCSFPPFSIITFYFRALILLVMSMCEFLIVHAVDCSKSLATNLQIPSATSG